MIASGGLIGAVYGVSYSYMLKKMSVRNSQDYEEDKDEGVYVDKSFKLWLLISLLKISDLLSKYNHKIKSSQLLW